MIIKITKFLFLYLLVLNNIQSQNYTIGNQIQFYISGQEILLSSKSVKFAKEITDYKVERDEGLKYCIQRKKVIGSSSSKGKEEVINSYIELEGEDYVVFKFRRNSIKDVNGADIYIFSDSLPNEIILSVSKDGEEWIEVGTVTDIKRYINLSGKIPFREKYSYIKVKGSLARGLKLKIHQLAVIRSNNEELGVKIKIVDGVIYTESNKVNLQIKDYSQFDGDLISVKVNGKVIAKTKLLTKWNRFVELPLKEGENKIVVTAKTEGWIKPNTIDLKVVDGIKINIGTYKIRKKKTKTIKIIRG